jgi:hypothetical protein
MTISTLSELKSITVLNYNENSVYAKTAPNVSIKFEPAINGEPSTTPLTLDEIKYLNNTNVFKTGILEFYPDLEDELYEVLRIDKDKVLKANEIRTILTNPTKDGLTKLLSMTSITDFDRVRGQFQKLKSEGYRLTIDVAELVEKRTKELFNNKIKSDFQIEKNDADTANQKRVDDLEKQLAEMKKLMMELQAQNSTVQNSVKEESTIEVTPVKKTPGRPKKSVS